MKRFEPNLKEITDYMKKLMSVLLGLSLLVPVAGFAQKKPAPEDKTTTHKGKKRGKGKHKVTTDKMTTSPSKD